MVNLLLAIHSHQPVGNFGGVFQEAYEKAYLPFLEILEGHPKIKISLHYSGSLLDWLNEKQPKFLYRLAHLVKKSQVEIISGGYYEPILALIPENDAIGQITLLSQRIKELFSFDARGFWTTERVWEPKLPAIVAKAGIEYTIIDDSHFKLVGSDPDSLSGFYITEEQGYKLFIFPGSEKLRYYIPFKLPEETIKFLGSINNDDEITISYGDDGEKFGLWPGTFKWVYKEKWLENFFSVLEENDSWVRTMTFSEYLKDHKPTDRVYLTCASYREMMEWSQGFYRNFFVKYPESNNMHKTMLYISNKINDLYVTGSTQKNKSNSINLKKDKVTLARRELYKGQANDAYWHGVFGGLYLNHLRSAVYNNLIEAEKIADNLLYKEDFVETESVDFDCDGREELIVNTKNQKVILRPYEGGALSFWSFKPKSLNLINTLKRRYEPYHEKLKKGHTDGGSSGAQPKSIHDVLEVKEAGLEKALFYDRYPRYCLMDYFMSPSTSLSDFRTVMYDERGNFLNKYYKPEVNPQKTPNQISLTSSGEVNGCHVALVKKITFNDKGLTIDYRVDNTKSKKNLSVLFGVEFNLSIYEPSLHEPGEKKAVKKFDMHDIWNQLKIILQFNSAMNIWYYPVETVSESESGIERTYQELCLFVWSHLEIDQAKSWANSLEIKLAGE